MTLRAFLFAGICFAAGAARVTAAPFCVEVTGIPLQCMFVDPALCRQEAFRQGGRCSANPSEFVTPVTALQYCLVESGNVTSCIYPDRADCDSESARRGGACVAALPVPPSVPAPAPGTDLFDLKRPY